MKRLPILIKGPLQTALKHALRAIEGGIWLARQASLGTRASASSGPQRFLERCGRTGLRIYEEAVRKSRKNHACGNRPPARVDPPAPADRTVRSKLKGPVL